MKTKGCKDIFDAPNKGPHYTFIIGNDQILQNKLESAVSEGKLQDFNFYRKAIGLISSSVYVIIIIIGVWIFIMRKCQEAEAEADRSSILENQKQNF
jgi:cell division protease FtsH